MFLLDSPACYRLQNAPYFLPTMTAATRLLFPVCPILTLIRRLLASQDLTKRYRAHMSTAIREESGTRLWAMDYVTMPRREGRAISTLLYRSTLGSQVVKTWLALQKTTTLAIMRLAWCFGRRSLESRTIFSLHLSAIRGVPTSSLSM
jgi:hypothetical protein